MVVAVPLLDVPDDLIPSVIAEINIEVRDTDPLRIKEPLKQQIKPQRINIRYPDKKRDKTSRSGTSSRSDRDILRLRPIDEILRTIRKYSEYPIFPMTESSYFTLSRYSVSG